MGFPAVFVSGERVSGTVGTRGQSNKIPTKVRGTGTGVVSHGVVWGYFHGSGMGTGENIAGLGGKGL
ncbi:MAG: hypothetical protein NC548_05300 [Lachnospiraceae bacterium]|nr:hypothetical protein [Lachnospiraceae bacterium]